MKVVIVGGVAGGAGAAARLRRNDEKAEIVVMERSGYISFANCGLPYYLGDVIKEREALLLQNPEGFHQRFNVDVRIHTEAQSIDPVAKTVTTKNLDSGEVYVETYDKLILSPGAKPVMPPIEGANSDKVFTLRNIEDTYKIKDYMEQNTLKTAVVIGGGYIGLEMAENMKHAGADVAIVEALPHVVATLDTDMSAELQNHIRDNGVKLYLNSQAVAIGDAGVTLKDGTVVPADIVVMSVGVRPETAFLAGSGIELGQRGEILVNQRLETNVTDVYAVGDAVSVVNIVTGKKQVIPLASPANKQARIVADVVCGMDASYRGAQGTAIAKVFDMNVGVTGMGETQLKAEGIPYRKTVTQSNSHASYYPGAMEMTIKMLFTPDEGKLLGAQIVGYEGVDKRIDVLAVAVRMGMNVFDLQEQELAYAPPFSSAKDPVNMAAYVAGNILTGKCKPIFVEELKDLTEDSVIIDIRTPEEYAEGTVNGALNFELDHLRENLDKLPKDKELIVMCRIGLRGHVGQSLLEQYGFKTRNFVGGYRYYLAQITNDPSMAL